MRAVFHAPECADREFIAFMPSHGPLDLFYEFEQHFRLFAFAYKIMHCIRPFFSRVCPRLRHFDPVQGIEGAIDCHIVHFDYLPAFFAI